MKIVDQTFHISPKPPDIETKILSKDLNKQVLSFIDKLIERVQHSLIIADSPSYDGFATKSQESNPLSIDFNSIGNQRIHLTEENQERIYQPWKYSIIIKLHGKNIQHHILKRKFKKFGKSLKIFL